MSAEARDLAVHLAKQVRNNPRLAYFIGPGSETWSLMVKAIGSITGDDSNALHYRLKEGLQTERPADPFTLVEAERAVIVRYMRHMATLRPDDANGLRVIASDVEVLFHHDPVLNPEGLAQ